MLRACASARKCICRPPRSETILGNESAHCSMRIPRAHDGGDGRRHALSFGHGELRSVIIILNCNKNSENPFFFCNASGFLRLSVQKVEKICADKLAICRGATFIATLAPHHDAGSNNSMSVKPFKRVIDVYECPLFEAAWHMNLTFMPPLLRTGNLNRLQSHPAQARDAHHAQQCLPLQLGFNESLRAVDDTIWCSGPAGI